MREPHSRTRVRRLPEKARYDLATVHQILDDAVMCHVAANVDGLAMTLPTLHVREGSTLYVHGSQSNALLRAALAQGDVFVTATLYDGLRLARSGFESSVAYRSVTLVARSREIDDLEQKRRVLDLLMDQLLPGRSLEVRPATERELRLTLVVALEIGDAAAKVSAGPLDESDEDCALEIWAGHVPVRTVFGEPIPDQRGYMSGGDRSLPPSLERWRERE